MSIKDTLLFLQKNNIEYEESPSLKKLSTFKVGGKALLLVVPKNALEISKIIINLNENNIDYMPIGNGSNLLFSDKGYNGVIIKPTFDSTNISLKDNIITAGAGMTLNVLCEWAYEYSLTGLEFAYGIPGTVGGALYMNAGAYNGEIKDVAVSCTFVDEIGRIIKSEKDELDLSYRHSMFSDSKKIIVDVSYELKKGKPLEIREKMNELFDKRATKQPLNYPSGGSTFKRPVGNYASALIDKCELKGKTVGGAMVSKKHAGFIINYNNATSSDVLDLINLVKKEVNAKTGYTLECEIKIIN